MTAVSWARGGTTGPVTERTEAPVTLALAKAEMWAALVASDPPGTPRPPVEARCTDLGVTWREPLSDTHPQWADGAYRALRWLVGGVGVKRARAAAAVAAAAPGRHRADGGRAV